MLRKRRIWSEDGLTFTEVVSLDSATVTAEDIRAVDALGLFPSGLPAVEQFWQPHAPPAGARVRHQSMSWYAREILQRIRRVQVELDRDGPRKHNLEAVAYGALHVGWLHGAAFIRFNLGKEARIGVNVRRRRQHAGRQSRKKRRLHYEDQNPIVKSIALRIRDRVPYSREHSTTWLAGEVARRLETNKDWKQKGYSAITPAAVRGRLRLIPLR